MLIKRWGAYNSAGDTSSAVYAWGIQHQTDFLLLDLDKVSVGPVAYKRLRFTPGELTPDQITVTIGQ